MFSNLGWGQIAIIIIVAIIVIGPERLPGLLQDIRAAIFAARRAINNAKKELNGEFEQLGPEFEQFREPWNKVTELGRMGPRAAITKALFDDDDQFLDQFDPRTIMRETDPNRPSASSSSDEDKPNKYSGMQPKRRPPRQDTADETQHQPSHSDADKGGGPAAAGGGFSWADIT